MESEKTAVSVNLPISFLQCLYTIFSSTSIHIYSWLLHKLQVKT